MSDKSEKTEKSAAATAIPTQATSSPEPLLKVDNLVKHFPIRKGLLQRQVAAVKAVDGISFDVRPGRPWVSWVSPAAASRRWGG